jgi:predicted transposase YdaD
VRYESSHRSYYDQRILPRFKEKEGRKEGRKEGKKERKKERKKKNYYGDLGQEAHRREVSLSINKYNEINRSTNARSARSMREGVKNSRDVASKSVKSRGEERSEWP